MRLIRLIKLSKILNIPIYEVDTMFDIMNRILPWLCSKSLRRNEFLHTIGYKIYIRQNTIRKSFGCRYEDFKCEFEKRLPNYYSIPEIEDVINYFLERHFNVSGYSTVSINDDYRESCEREFLRNSLEKFAFN